MVKKIDQGIIIILDVGKNMSEEAGKGEESFFKQARDLTARIIERKILSHGKDYIGVILLGSKKTLNNMAEQCEGGFRNIETMFKLQSPLWKCISDLPEEPTKKSGDWIEALTVAADHVQNEVSGVNFVKMKIILITNFQKNTRSEKNLEMVVQGLKEYKYEVDIFGPDIYDEDNKNPDFQMAREFVQQTNGQTGTFKEIMQYLQFHKMRAIRPSPWNVDLSIGPYIKIPITSYIRLKDDKVIQKWKESVNDRGTSKSSTTEGVVKDTIYYNPEDQSKIDPSEVIKVYKMGHRSIPVSELDESMLYQSGIRSLTLYGFTLASNVQWQHLNGTGLSYVFGRKGDNKAQQAITCLVKILHEKKLVGIARQVYNNNNAPKMVVLMPVIDTSDYMCLSMASLCYKETIKYMLFPTNTMKKFPCTKDQVKAMKDLITAMDLTKAYDETFDGTEAFPTGEIISPSIQYILDCFAYRALNPDKPLPPPRDDIMNLFKIPPSIENKTHEPLKRIKEMFTLQKVEERIKRRRKKLLDVSGIDEPIISIKSENEEEIGVQKITLPSTSVSNDKCTIGTINPVKDFTSLLNQGKPLAELVPEMTDAIESLLLYNLDGTYTKALDAMTLFRNECLKSDPSHYNNWLQKFKVGLTNRNRQDLHALIKDKGVDFIIKSENSKSLFETAVSHDESQMYEVDTVPESTDMFFDPDIDAMFDEM